MNHKYSSRPDFFFPIALITAGIAWLLINYGIIPADNLLRLLPLWPVLLILGGLGLILRQLWWPLPAFLWLAAGAAVLWLLMTPQNVLPQFAMPEIKHETFSEGIGTAKSAIVELDLSVNPAKIHALPAGKDLIVADIYHRGNTSLTVSGSSPKTVKLDETPGNMTWMDWNWVANSSGQPWDIGLAPDVPLDLDLNLSTGSTEMDLSQLQLTALAIDASTGRVTMTLPEDSSQFPFTLKQSTGSFTIVAPEESTFTLDVDGSTGSLTIDVADGAGVQVEVRDDGTGSLNLPADFEKVEQGSDDDLGVWENAAYAGSGTPIRITLDMSTGSVTIQ